MSGLSGLMPLRAVQESIWSRRSTRGPASVNAIVLLGWRRGRCPELYNITEAERDKYDSVFKKFDDFFQVRKNVIFERAKFNTHLQGEDESVKEFITAFYHLGDTCNYGPIREQTLRDWIVVGIRDWAL